ncbi:MAG TPA: pirin family protein [Gammaproteobacteria bacterium]|nr:pirin family protein [Gammaproteobacteria bacterium]
MDKSNDDAATRPTIEALPAHEATVGGGMQVRRALPHRLRRRVGAWCFLDHYGPVTLKPQDEGMRVGPHPHMGLQTVSWLFEGSVLHRDSLGSLQHIEPGQLNLMTAGRGISHSEETPAEHPPGIHGLQFWIALPESRRHGEPAFDHHPRLPDIRRDGLEMTLIVGEALGERSPAKAYTPLAGLDIVCRDSGSRRLPLNPAFEHALFLIEGEMTLEGQPMAPGTLYYLGPGRERVSLGNKGHARAFLLGGEPLREDVLLWWNFVGRSTEEMQQARTEWQARAARFGEVQGYDGERLTAPELTGRLKAR